MQVLQLQRQLLRVHGGGLVQQIDAGNPGQHFNDQTGQFEHAAAPIDPSRFEKKQKELARKR